MNNSIAFDRPLIGNASPTDTTSKKKITGPDPFKQLPTQNYASAKDQQQPKSTAEQLLSRARKPANALLADNNRADNGRKMHIAGHRYRRSLEVNQSLVKDMDVRDLVTQAYADNPTQTASMVLSRSTLSGEIQLLRRFSADFKKIDTFDYQKFSEVVTKKSATIRTWASKATGISKGDLTTDDILTACYKLALAIKNKWASDIPFPPSGEERDMSAFKTQVAARLTTAVRPLTTLSKSEIDFIVTILSIYDARFDVVSPDPAINEKTNDLALPTSNGSDVHEVTSEFTSEGYVAENALSVSPSAEENSGKLSDLNSVLTVLRDELKAHRIPTDLNVLTLKPHADSRLGKNNANGARLLKILSDDPAFKLRAGKWLDSTKLEIDYNRGSVEAAYYDGKWGQYVMGFNDLRQGWGENAEAIILAAKAQGGILRSDGTVGLEQIVKYYGITLTTPRTEGELTQLISDLEDKLPERAAELADYNTLLKELAGLPGEGQGLVNLDTAFVKPDEGSSIGRAYARLFSHFPNNQLPAEYVKKIEKADADPTRWMITADGSLKAWSHDQYISITPLDSPLKELVEGLGEFRSDGTISAPTMLDHYRINLSNPASTTPANVRFIVNELQQRINGLVISKPKSREAAEVEDYDIMLDELNRLKNVGEPVDLTKIDVKLSRDSRLGKHNADVTERLRQIWFPDFEYKIRHGKGDQDHWLITDDGKFKTRDKNGEYVVDKYLSEADPNMGYDGLSAEAFAPLKKSAASLGGEVRSDGTMSLALMMQYYGINPSDSLVLTRASRHALIDHLQSTKDALVRGDNRDINATNPLIKQRNGELWDYEATVLTLRDLLPQSARPTDIDAEAISLHPNPSTDSNFGKNVDEITKDLRQFWIPGFEDKIRQKGGDPNHWLITSDGTFKVRNQMGQYVVNRDLSVTPEVLTIFKQRAETLGGEARSDGGVSLATMLKKNYGIDFPHPATAEKIQAIIDRLNEQKASTALGMNAGVGVDALITDEDAATIARVVKDFLSGEKTTLLEKLGAEIPLHSLKKLLATPTFYIAQLLQSRAAEALGRELLKALGWRSTEPISSEVMTKLLWKAVTLDLDPPHSPSDGKIAGYDLEQSGNWEQSYQAIRSDFRAYLVSSGKLSSPKYAALGESMLNKNFPPDFLIEDIPPDLHYGSIVWVNFAHGVNIAEAIAPGSTRRMGFQELVNLPAVKNSEATTDEQKMFLAEARLKPTLVWAVANGFLPTKAEGEEYTAAQIEAAVIALDKQENDILTAINGLNQPPLDRSDMATKEIERVGLLPSQLFAHIWFGTVTLDRDQNIRLEGLHSAYDIKHKPKSLLEIYMSGDIDLSRWSVPTNTTRVQGVLDSDQTASRYASLPNLNKKFEENFNAYLTKQKSGYSTVIQNLLSKLPLADRVAINDGEVSLYSLRKQGSSTQTDKDESDSEPLRGRYGFIIEASYKGKKTYYEVFPKAMKIRPRPDLKSLLVNGEIRFSLNPISHPTGRLRIHEATTLPFDWNAYSTGSAPDAGTSSKLIANKIGESFPSHVTNFRKDDRFTSPLSSSRPTAIGNFIAEKLFYVNETNLHEISYEKTPLETERESSHPIVTLGKFVVPFWGAIEDLSSEDPSRKRQGALGLIIDLVSFGIPVGKFSAGSVRVIIKAGKRSFSSAIPQFASLTKKLFVSVANEFNPLSGLPSVLKWGGTKAVKLSRTAINSINTGIEQFRKLHKNLPKKLGEYEFIGGLPRAIESGKWRPKAAGDQLRTVNGLDNVSVRNTASATSPPEYYLVDPISGLPYGPLLSKKINLDGYESSLSQTRLDALTSKGGGIYEAPDKTQYLQIGDSQYETFTIVARPGERYIKHPTRIGDNYQVQQMSDGQWEPLARGGVGGSPVPAPLTPAQNQQLTQLKEMGVRASPQDKAQLKKLEKQQLTWNKREALQTRKSRAADMTNKTPEQRQADILDKIATLHPDEKILINQHALSIDSTRLQNGSNAFFYKSGSFPTDIKTPASAQTSKDWYRAMSKNEFDELEAIKNKVPGTENKQYLQNDPNGYGGISPTYDYSHRYFNANSTEQPYLVRFRVKGNETLFDKFNGKGPSLKPEDGIESYGLGPKGTQDLTVQSRESAGTIFNRMLHDDKIDVELVGLNVTL